MSVTAYLETRSRSNALCVPIQSVTIRVPTNSAGTNLTGSATVAGSGNTNKIGEGSKPADIVFVVEGDHVKAVQVKYGISDDNYTEITDGLKEGQEVVSGGPKAINRDLEDGGKVVTGAAAAQIKPKAAAN
jgi:HlyD family secretion protein